MKSWDLTTLDVEVHKPQVLISEDGAQRVIAVNLPAGDLLQDHEVREHATLVLASGKLEIDADGTTTTASAGFVAHWEPHERHEVRAVEDSRFLLVLAPWPAADHHT